MVNLRELIDYFRDLCDHPATRWNTETTVEGRVPGIKGFVVDTVSAESGKKYQGLSKGQCPVLGLLLPTAQSVSTSADAVMERNTVVVVLLDKYDPQRKDAVETCVETQPLIEAVKRCMIEDKADGCKVLGGLNVESFSTMPETGVYGTLAGWSLGFTFDTFGLGDCNTVTL